METKTISTIDTLMSMGFSLLGDSRDFTTSSIELTFGRGNERLTWIFPMSKAAICVNAPEGSTVLRAQAEQISFDVVVSGSSKLSVSKPPEGPDGI